jgi:hypothetical protein
MRTHQSFEAEVPEIDAEALMPECLKMLVRRRQPSDPDNYGIGSVFCRRRI